MKVGIIAGRGIYPILLCQEAVKQGVEIFVLGFVDETDKQIEQYATKTSYVYVGQLSKTLKFFQNNDVKDIVFAGQIKPKLLFKGLKLDFKAFLLMLKLKERNASSIFGAFVDFFNKKDIKVLPATSFMEDFLAKEGQMGSISFSRARKKDVEFGKKIAFEISRLDIGQSCVVKKGTVLAVEGFEGTDKAILRGGELGRGNVTVVKVAKDNQDMRFDVPCIGMRTVEHLIQAKATTLAVQAEKTLFLEKDKVIEACNKAKICVIAFTR